MLTIHCQIRQGGNGLDLDGYGPHPGQVHQLGYAPGSRDLAHGGEFIEGRRGLVERSRGEKEYRGGEGSRGILYLALVVCIHT